MTDVKFVGMSRMTGLKPRYHDTGRSGMETVSCNKKSKNAGN